jgi:triosephosphate isomerase
MSAQTMRVPASSPGARLSPALSRGGRLARSAFTSRPRVAIRGAPRAAIFQSADDKREAVAALESALRDPAERPTRRPLMAGNWKMNPGTLAEAETLAALVAAAAKADGGAAMASSDVLCCPPAPFLAPVAAILKGSGVALGCQNVYHASSGAYTGETSLAMAASVGCEFVLVGHSERRELFGETDEMVGLKTRAILDAGLKPVICVGESQAQYDDGLVRDVCAAQLAGALASVSAAEMASGRVVIAYEPVWAIGTGLTATPAIAQSVHAFIRGWIRRAFGDAAADAVVVQYGGSVKPDSVDELMQCPDVDGCLVGGASLQADAFARIFGFDASPPGPVKLWAEEVAETKMQLGESPVWCAESRTLYWVDAPGKALWSWDLVHDPIKAEMGEVCGFVALRANGTLLLGLDQSGIVAYDPRTRAREVLAAFEPGRNTRPNDARTDRFGNLVVGSYNNDWRADAKEIGSVWQMPAGTRDLVEMLDYNIRCSNATCFTPDGRTMFFCDSPTRRIYCFDYEPRSGVSNRRLLFELPSDMDGSPDGAQCDADGCLWVAISGASKVIRITRDGVVDHEVELPVKSPTSVTFGGRELDTLFITTRAPDGGSVYAVKAPEGIRGVPEVAFGDVSAIVPEAGRAGGAGMGAVRAVNLGGVLAGLGVESSGGGAGGAAKFCGNCGARFQGADGNFCTECGAPRR